MLEPVVNMYVTSDTLILDSIQPDLQLCKLIVFRKGRITYSDRYYKQDINLDDDRAFLLAKFTTDSIDYVKDWINL